jgi:hypothetical protein
LCAIGLLPWAGLQAAGAATWLVVVRPAWLQAHRVPALLLLLSSLALAWAGGVTGLRWWRQAGAGLPRWRAAGQARQVARSSRPEATSLPGSTQRVTAAPKLVVARLPWRRALLVLPLLRGPARRSGHLWLLAVLVLLLPALGLWIWPAGGGWWLAAYATLAAAASARLNRLTQEQLAPLLQAAPSLPLSARRLEAARQGLAWWPLWPGLLALGGALALQPVRWWVALAFALGCLGANAWQLRQPADDAATQSARGLFLLVLCLALASEVLP